MIGILVLAVICIAVYQFYSTLGQRRSGASDPVEREMTGMILEKKLSMLGMLNGKSGQTVAFRSDTGAQEILSVWSRPLFQILQPGVHCAIRVQGNQLVGYEPDQESAAFPVREETIMAKTLLKNGAVFGKGTMDVLIEDGKIIAVGENLSADAEIVDLSGKTVLPGFINAHVHLYGVGGPLPDDLIRQFVTGGCTTVRDMGMTSPLEFTDYMEWLETRKTLDFPTVITSGKFLAGENTYGMVHPSGKRIGYLIEETPEGARAAVDAMADAGAQQIKTGLDYGMNIDEPLDYLAPEVFAEICKRAHERGLRASAHITKRDKFVEAAQLGLDEAAHTPTNLLTDEDVELVAKSGMAFNTTGSIFDMVSAMSGEPIMDAVISNIGRLYRAGVPMSIGTDYMHEGAPFQTAGIPVHELQLLIRAGLTVEEAVQAATLDTAAVLGIDAVCGSIDCGKQADIIATDIAVDESFAALTPDHVVFVMHQGEILKR